MIPLSRAGTARLPYVLRCAAVALALTLLSGCLVDATLDADGSGTMTVKYRLTTAAQLESSKRRMQSGSVKLLSAKVEPDKWATYQLKVSDVTKLNSTEFFSKAKFALTGDKDVKTLSIKYANPDASEMPADMINYFGREVSFTLHCPGPVVDSNGTSVEGNTVTWKYTTKEFSTIQEKEYHVTYKLAPGAANAGAAGSESPASAAATPVASTPAAAK